MSRARNIKPGFFRNADLVELPVETRLLFIGLWGLADREGRIDDRPKQIKMEVYPADSFDVDSMLNQLQDAGFIERYEANGNKYIQVANFAKHQNPHRDEKASTIPAPCKHHASTVQNGLIPESLLLNPDVLNPEQNSAPEKREPKKNHAPATRLPADWTPSVDDLAFCNANRPDLNTGTVADSFRDYWIAAPGAKGRKADWPATWRNWVRNQRQANAPPQSKQANRDSYAAQAQAAQDRLNGGQHEQHDERDITGQCSRVT